MKTKNIEHTVLFQASPQEVYDVLMDSKKHAQFTGDPAKIRGKVGGAFTCYNNYITGTNLVLEPGKLIVQAWHSDDWPAETWSIVTFKLAKKAGGKTELKFTHIGVPADNYARKNSGWRTHYWEPLKRYLEK